LVRTWPTPRTCVSSIPDGDVEDCGASIFETPDDDADIIAPDTEFRYGGARWQVAGAVAESVSGKTWDELIDEIYVESLSQDALDTMHADRVAAVYSGDAAEDTGHGMGWWVDRETGRISDGGAYGSVPWLDLDDGYGAYLVIGADSGTGNTLAGLLEVPITDAIAAAS
jgi:CubicO group peptidase (beta-lactamase class C family)